MVREDITVDSDGRAEGAVEVRPVGKPVRIGAEEAFDVRGIRVARLGAR